VVYDEELYTIKEALLIFLTPLTNTKYIYIYIKNQVAVQALYNKKIIERVAAKPSTTQ
jgi:hypothetical protein